MFVRLASLGVLRLQASSLSEGGVETLATTE